MSGAEQSGWDFSVSVPWLSVSFQPVPSLLQALHSDLGSVFLPGKWGRLGVLCEVLPGPRVWGERVAARPPRLLPIGERFPWLLPVRSPESEACGSC